jgi:hypothetical protein
MTDMSQHATTSMTHHDATQDTSGFGWLIPERKKRSKGSSKKKSMPSAAEIKDRIGERPFTVVSVTEEQKQNALDMARETATHATSRIWNSNAVPRAVMTRQPK